MHYFIDGYNLLFYLFHSDDRFQEQREQLINELSHQFNILNIDATLVFDAQYQEGDEARSHFLDLEVIFTNQGVTADEYIINSLKNRLRQADETVVTSDKKLAWYARRCSAKTETVDHFLNLLAKRYRNKLRLKTKKLVGQPVKKSSTLMKKPASNSNPEECQDYYLQIFEEEYKKIKKAEPERKLLKNKEKGKNVPKEKKKEEPAPFSEMERWLRLFENQ